MIQTVQQYLDIDEIWKKVKDVRNAYLKKEETSLSCKTLYKDTLKTPEIITNFNILSEIFAVKNVSDEPYELPPHIIETGADMFIHLNSCPYKPHHWGNLFVDLLSDASISKFYLTTMKIFKTSVSNDAKIIIHKLLQKLRSLYPMKHIYTEKTNSENKHNYNYKLIENFVNVKGSTFHNQIIKYYLINIF